MTNPIFNPQPNYSGVMIQIANPAVNVGSNGVGLSGGTVNSGYPYGYSQNPILNSRTAYPAYPNGYYYNNGFQTPQGMLNPNAAQYPANIANSNGQQVLLPNNGQFANPNGQVIDSYGQPVNGAATGYSSAYPAGYYLNDYTQNPENAKTANGYNDIAKGQNGVGSNSENQITSDKNLSNNNGNEFNNDSINRNNADNNSYNSNGTDNNIKNNSESDSINPNEKMGNVYNKDDQMNAIDSTDSPTKGDITADGFDELIPNEYANNSDRDHSMNSYKMYANSNETKPSDMTTSKNIIEDLDEREAKIQEEKKNSKETKIVALTDEYIKSLENYLNNPNDELRLMASKEVLTRLDEDKDRYNDAALNALLNKMMQDPNKLVRIAALSAFASQLASGNDYTVQLLRNIQANPDADKEDILQAADILLKMSAGVEVKNIPNPQVKQNQQS